MVLYNCLPLHLSDISLEHILERSSVGICLLCVGLVKKKEVKVVSLDRSKRFTLFASPGRPVHSDTNSASPGSYYGTPRGYSCYVVFPFLVYEETYTCLSIVDIRVVQQVATLESCETFLFSSEFS